MRASLWTFLDPRYPTAYRSGMPGAARVAAQSAPGLRLSGRLGDFSCMGMSAAQALRVHWDPKAGDPPTPYELERQAADFRASMGAS